MWNVYRRFKLDRGMALGIGTSVLMQLTLNGDLEAFLSSWDYAMMALKKQPDADQEGTKERSAGFLYNCARQEVLRKQRERTLDDLIKRTPTAPCAILKGEPKGRARPTSPRA